MPYTTFDPPLEFDGTPERAELNNRIINLQLEREAACADRDRLAAELAALKVLCREAGGVLRGITADVSAHVPRCIICQDDVMAARNLAARLEAAGKEE